MEQVQILVVEDSKMFASVICGEIRGKLGFESIVASTLKEAKNLVEQKPGEFFLAILDLHLPDAHDEEIVDYFLSKNIPSIVFTSNFNDDTRERILSQNIVDYILKESTQDVEYLVRTIGRIYKNLKIEVLVVDDSNVTRTMVRNLLETHKFIVFEASNGREGLEKLKLHPAIKLIITDYSMPEMDGFQFVSQVRKKYPSDRVAIIGISAHGSSLMSAKFLKKGASDFINKPFVKEEFYCRVTQNIDMLEYIEAIQEASHKDYLTGLYNRRYFFDLGEKIFENAKRGNLNITIAMIDIDRFKQINDTYGHEAGDSALKRIADCICQNKRASDIISRYGGEEFCMMAVNMDKEKIPSFFERMRNEIESNVMPCDENKICLTASIGVCSQIKETLQETINRADELMYQAKQKGRNTVIIE